MAETLLRHLVMLSLIPRPPRRISAGQLRAELTKRGFADVTLRSVQRNLADLSAVVPLANDGSKPLGWFWQAEASALSLPGLDPQAALVFKLVESYLKPLLPAATLDYLRPWFGAATGVLDANGEGLSKWPEKIRVHPRGQPLLPPRVDPAVQDTVYQALLEEKRLQLTYRRPGRKETIEYQVSPLSIVVRHPVTYLVCTMWEYSDLRHLVLHRMLSAEVLDKPINRPEGYDVDEHIAKGEFGFAQGGTIHLVADFDRGAAAHLAETPLSEDQVITELDEDTWRIEATVADTMELRAWLRGLGEEVEVLEPSKLRVV